MVVTNISNKESLSMGPLTNAPDITNVSAAITILVTEFIAVASRRQSKAIRAEKWIAAFLKPSCHTGA